MQFKVCVVSSTRADLGYLRFIIKAMKKDPQFEPIVVATCMHLAPSLGKSLSEFSDLDIHVDEELETLLDSDSPSGIAKTMGLGMISFADFLRKWKPDAVLVMGDRFEVLSFAAVCIPFLIPVIHLSGGDYGDGAIDGIIRNALTKLSHFHLPAIEPYAKRLEQMGEEKWRICTVGEPTLEFIHQEKLMTKQEVEKHLSFSVTEKTLLITYHPETLSVENIGEQISIFVKTLEKLNVPMIITGPNVDTGSGIIRETLIRFSQYHSNVIYRENLGHRCFLSLLQYVGAMVGNSSSGIVEAPSFELPVVNVGARQMGRIQSKNVLNVPMEEKALLLTIDKALSKSFRESLMGLKNPYGDGKTSDMVIKALKRWLPQHIKNRRKQFIEI